MYSIEVQNCVMFTKQVKKLKQFRKVVSVVTRFLMGGEFLGGYVVLKGFSLAVFIGWQRFARARGETEAYTRVRYVTP